MVLRFFFVDNVFVDSRFLLDTRHEWAVLRVAEDEPLNLRKMVF